MLGWSHHKENARRNVCTSAFVAQQLLSLRERTGVRRPQIDPRSLQNPLQIATKSDKNRSGGPWGDLGRAGGPWGHSREVSGGASELPRSVPRCSWSVLKAPESPPRRLGEAAGSLFRATFSQSVSQEAPAAISDRILGRLPVARGLFHCTGAVFREGRPFLVRAACRAPKRAKIDPRATPERPQIEAERTGERSLAQDRRFFGKRSERRRGAAQRERFGGAVGAPRSPGILTRFSYYT